MDAELLSVTSQVIDPTFRMALAWTTAAADPRWTVVFGGDLSSECRVYRPAMTTPEHEDPEFIAYWQDKMFKHLEFKANLEHHSPITAMFYSNAEQLSGGLPTDHHVFHLWSALASLESGVRQLQGKVPGSGR